MSDEDTKFYLKTLRECLKSSQPGYQWRPETRVYSGNHYTQIDIFGAEDDRIILIQFEMRRRNPDDNAAKAMDCLAADSRFNDKRALMLHVFSPWYDPTSYEIADDKIPDNVDKELFSKWWKLRATGQSARQAGFKAKQYSQCLASQGWPNCRSRAYRVVVWDVDDLSLRMEIMLSRLSHQQMTSQMARLSGQVSTEVDRWEAIP